jgi:hypothetical protein
LGKNISLRERFSPMKSPLAFGIGLVSGAIITSTFLVSLPRDRPPNEAEIATLRADLSHAQKAAQHDREALRSAVQERQALRDVSPPKPASLVATPEVSKVVSGNSAIAAYLGAPVPVPVGLDHKYSPEEVSAVFRDLAETLGIKIDKLDVDTTEFPFVIHGRVDSTAGASFFKKIESELRALPGYTYGGSVTGDTRDGSTYFALNITPSSAYPPGQAEAIGRRLTLRLQMVAASRGE